MDTTPEKQHAHVLSIGVLVGTWVALLILTGVTVYVARMDLGQLNIVAALGIASFKAAIVALIFMHLKYGGRFIPVAFVSAVVFAVILIGFVLFDTTQYQQDIVDYQADKARAAETTPAELPQTKPNPSK